MVNELPYAGDLILMSEITEDLKERFSNWKNALESKGLNVNTGKIKVIISRSKEQMFESKIDPRGVSGRRVMPSSVLCTKCGNWVDDRCAKIRIAIYKLTTRFVCLKCSGIIEGTMDSIEKLCDKGETVNGFCYLGDRLNSSGRLFVKQQPQQK